MSDNQNISSDLIGQRQIRLNKIKRLKELGVDPYPAKSNKQHSNAEIVNNFEKFEEKIVILSGMITSKRTHGKLIFLDLVDDSGKIQIYIKEDTLNPSNYSDLANQTLGFNDLDLLDLDDYIEVTGTVTKTIRGEISVLAKSVRILAKTIRPIPTELTDKEERFRRRYVDMKVNPEVKERMKRRALFWQAHREFFNSRGFYEVNIPILEHVPGGGDAVPFTTHMNALDEDFFLRISHELPLKRLIGAGFEKVYDIGARFRNEGLSDEHLPEHVAMEFYWAYADWKDGMLMIQDLYNYIIEHVYNGQTKFQIREFEVEFKKEWDIIDFNEVMNKTYGIKDIYSITIEEVKDLLTKNGIQFERSINIPRGVDSLWKKIRKNVAGPAFLINHPKYLSPLQKPSLENPNMVERFQPIIAGSELGNGWSELNDPVDQYERFLEQQKLRDAGDEEAQWLDIDYVEMLEYGMAPTFGYGHSERVFWFLENVTAREGVPFPQLKQEFDELTQKIYPEVFENSSNNSESEDVAGLPSIKQAYDLLDEYVTEDYHKLHAKMVASAMRSYAKKYGRNEKLWYLTGLLHDLDYTKFPEEHPKKSLEWFKEWGYPKSLIQAVAAHAWDRTNVKPQSLLDKALVATDEMCGLFYAYSLMRPTKFEGMELKSVLKRFKEKGFAPKISREEISYGVEILGVTIEDHAQILLDTFTNMKEFGGSTDFSEFEETTQNNSELNQDFDNRIAIVVNQDLPMWQIANAVAHVSAYIGNQLKERFATGDNFVTNDGKNHPRNSQYAIVVFGAKPGQLGNFMEKVRQSGNLYHGFIREMIETTNDTEIINILKDKKDSEIEYLGIGVYGDNETLKKLTNKFSLLK